MNKVNTALEVKTRLDRPVVMTGMMGSGKSHVGRLLAAMLELPFFDSDRLVEEEAGCTITEIFRRDGEPRFRAAEKKIILSLLDGKPKIIATGGGALMDSQTLDSVLSKSITVWLKADVESLAARIEKAGDRPLLSGGNPREKLEKLLETRAPVYRRAAIAVNTIEGSPADTADEVLAALRDFIKQAGI